MMQMAAQSFKVTFNGEVRRLPACDVPNHDFDSFASALSSLFPAAKEGKVAVEYTDGDGDRVTVRSTAELSESFLALPGPCRAFSLRPDGPRPTVVVGNARPVAVCRVAVASRGANNLAKGEQQPQKPKPKAKQHQQRPKEAMEEAARLSAAGQPTEARDLLARTVEAFPRAALAWVRLAAAHSALGATAESLAAFERAVGEGFGNIKLSLSDEGLEAIRTHPKFTSLLLSMAKAKFEKENQGDAQEGGRRKEGATLGGFLASKVLFFRTSGGVAPSSALAFAQACLDDPQVDPCPMLLFQSAVAAAASGANGLAVELLGRAAGAGFRFPGKVKNEAAFDPVRQQLDAIVHAMMANKRAATEKEQPQAATQRALPSSAAVLSAPPPESVTTNEEAPSKPEHFFHPELPTLRALGFAAPDSVLSDLLEKHNGDVSQSVAALLGA